MALRDPKALLGLLDLKALQDQLDLQAPLEAEEVRM
jgi:hypothetical protein